MRLLPCLAVAGTILAGWSSACESNAVMRKPGSDDKAFRLAKVADRLCGALEKRQLGD